jgi:N-acetylmuramoyl-L-alanine amidase
MPAVKSSVQSAVGKGTRIVAATAPARPVARGAVFAAALLIMLGGPSSPLSAQQPVMRIGDQEIQGFSDAGSAYFPAAALHRLGFRLQSSDASLAASLDSDTLRFWSTSPFFRDGSTVAQLAFPVRFMDSEAYLPEQFFIQWLPARFPARFEFRGGAVAVRGEPPAPAVQTPAPAVQTAVPSSPTTSPTAAATGARPQIRDSAAAAAPVSRPAGSAAARPAAGPRVVVIDPGHGGRDPGKVGPNSLRESDVTLMVAQRLATVLRERGYEVHMTRTTDTFVPLAERTRLANQWQAGRPGSVFLSIHANSFTSANVRGFETFFLSEARTEDERRVAEMENAVIRFEDNPQRPAGNGLDQILLNLHSEYLTRASHDLAAIMQDRMAAFHPGPNRGVKRAPFYVLVGAVMPAVLIETAFISNREEANLLGSQSFQQRLAWGIADGVDEFFRRNEHLWAGSR